jgi:hypothetical protein
MLFQCGDMFADQRTAHAQPASRFTEAALTMHTSQTSIAFSVSID